MQEQNLTLSVTISHSEYMWLIGYARKKGLHSAGHAIRALIGNAITKDYNESIPGIE